MAPAARRQSRFFGTRRESVALAGIAIWSAYDAVTASGVVAVLARLAFSAWLAWGAWRRWVEPTTSPTYVQRNEARRRWIGRHPARSAGIGAACIAALLFPMAAERVAVGALVCTVTGALIGIGLYAVFRTDPAYRPAPELGEPST